MPASDTCAAEVSEGADEPEAILKCFRADIHLVVAEIDAGVDFMLAADQVEIILEGVDVRFHPETESSRDRRGTNSRH